jgi:hypothetical protein
MSAACPICGGTGWVRELRQSDNVVVWERCCDGRWNEIDTPAPDPACPQSVTDADDYVARWDAAMEDVK